MACTARGIALSGMSLIFWISIGPPRCQQHAFLCAPGTIQHIGKIGQSCQFTKTGSVQVGFPSYDIECKSSVRREQEHDTTELQNATEVMQPPYNARHMFNDVVRSNKIEPLLDDARPRRSCNSSPPSDSIDIEGWHHPSSGTPPSCAVGIGNVMLRPGIHWGLQGPISGIVPLHTSTYLSMDALCAAPQAKSTYRT